MPEIDHHYAMVGIALNAGGYPLYFDAANEKGLGMGGLNYPDNAIYIRCKRRQGQHRLIRIHPMDLKPSSYC